MAAVTGPDSAAASTNAPRTEDASDALFTRLVEAYQGAILRMCYLYLHDLASAEDAAQDTFLKAYKSLHTYRSEAMARTWLMSIAINTCRDYRRSAWFRHNERRVTPEELPLAAPPRNEDALALAQALQRLPKRLLDATILYYYHDMTIQEVAEALHTAPSTITKRLSQARDRLRTLLAEEITPSAGADERRGLQ